MKKKSMFKSMVPTLSMLLCGVMALSGATYAWFTASSTATIDPMEINVVSAGGLEISTDAKTWTSSLKNLVFDNIILQPLSSAGALNTADNSLKLFESSYSGSTEAISGMSLLEAPTSLQAATTTNAAYNRGTTADQTGASKYLQFDVFFRNTKATPINVDLTGTAVTGTAGSSQDAIRMAFKNSGYFSADADITGNIPTLLGTPAISSIYEPNAAVHTQDGINDYTGHGGTAASNAKYEYLAVKAAGAEAVIYDRYTGYGYTEAADGGYVNVEGKFVVYNATTHGHAYNQVTNATAASAAGVYDKDLYVKSGSSYVKVFDGATSAWTEDNAFSNTATYFTYDTVTPVRYTRSTDTTAALFASVTTTDESAQYITIPANSVSKITVYIWIEGQDADCTNYVAGKPFTVNFQFNVVEDTVEEP